MPSAAWRNLFNAEGGELVVTLDVATMARFKALQSRALECTGHVDFNLKGGIDDIQVAMDSRVVSSLAADYEVSFHTHTSDYASTFPDIPSRVDFRHIAASIGMSNEVAKHLIFAPRFVFVIGVSPRLCERAKRDLDGIARDVEAAWLAATPSELGTDAFRMRYIAAVNALGFEVATHPTVYAEPISFAIRPVEPRLASEAKMAAAAGVVGLAALVAAASRGRG